VFILACERPKPPVNGIAGFEVGRTRLGSVGGIPTNAGKFTRVYAGSVKLAERTASVELLFNGAQTDSVLLEILLDIPGCRPELLDKDLVGRIGKPTEQADKNAFWALKYVFIAARVVGPAKASSVSSVMVVTETPFRPHALATPA